MVADQNQELVEVQREVGGTDYPVIDESNEGVYAHLCHAVRIPTAEGGDGQT